jgi:hypothetical protein
MKFKEDDLQMSCARYLDYSKLLWCHVGNERRTSIQAGVRLKKKGVKKGVPDILIFEPRGNYNGLAIELKIKPNKTSKEQKQWLDNLTKKGWLTDVCYSFDEFEQLITKYLEL